ncbi:chromosome segregation SMC family protein [Pseudoalteromonas aurantia]|uniref:Chromosome partition protein Smc n=1 Tax=Pseudoalteromonas aurantia 208 TaxID=1314867 RepID=A0ABR9EDC2_9GAMM|nr:AAA family ATPase [Pseudoalteromonas aurantia]MBE0368983.1 chromosome segregation protein [Pseudoalteromonas aurantia 208]
MRLSSIKLAGFKSFVEPTKIPFVDQMTCVVGPNGCGKSNVIDAVRWVLGESSAKNLRGDAMTDVIFNGSTNRKPISQASVELMFDNAQGRLPGTLADRSKVSIKRLVTRDGQSLYFLNGSKCRKRDITDIFLGTGLGPRSYAIIEQGMISRLIESKPQELRTFLEEAAGVSKYKERRRETQTRIKSTRENLERLLDVRKELQLQLGRLAIQAKDAKSYRTLKQQERTYKGQLAVLKWQNFHEKQQQKLHHIEKVRSEIDFLNVAHSGHNDILATLDTQIAQLTDSVAEQSQSLHKTHTSLTKAEQQKIHFIDKSRGLQAQIDKHRKSVIEERAQLEINQADIVVLDGALQDCVNSVLASHTQLEKLEVYCQQVLQEFQSVEAHQQQLADEVARAQSSHIKAEQQYTQCQQHEKYIVEKYRECEVQLQVLGQEDPSKKLTDVQHELAAKTRQIARLQASVQDQQNVTDTLTGNLNVARQAFNSRQQKNTALVASIEALTGVLDPENSEPYVSLLSELRVKAGYEIPVERALLGLNHLKVTTSAADDAVWPDASGVISGSVAEVIVDGVYPALLNHIQLLAQGESFNPSQFWVLGVDRAGTLYGKNWRATLKHTDSDSLLSQHAKLRALQQQVPQAESQLTKLEEEVETLIAQRAQSAHAEVVDKEEIHALAQQVAGLQSRHEMLKSAVEQWHESYAMLEKKQAELSGQLRTEQAALAKLQTAYEQSQARLSQHQLHITASKADYELKAQSQQHVLRDKDRVLANVHAQTLKEQQARNTLQLAQSKVDHVQKSLDVAHERAQGLLDEQQLLQEPMLDVDEQIVSLLAEQTKQQAAIDSLTVQLQAAKTQLQQKQVSLKGSSSEVSRLKELLQKHLLEEQGLAIKAQAALEPLEALEQDLQKVQANLFDGAHISGLQTMLNQTASSLNELGAVNLAAITEFDEAAQRKTYLDDQLDDLTSALKTLENAIRKIDKETKIRFKTTFDQINDDLKELFPKVFGGGSAYLELTSDDLLESGVSIMARPPGKKNSTIHLLSGGEKALTALSLVFSIFRLNPAPFCMLDEVDAPLDDANVGRFCRLVEEMSHSVQFIYISHNKIAMEMAGRLTGVTMAEPGVSRMVAVDVEQAVQMAQA